MKVSVLGARKVVCPKCYAKEDELCTSSNGGQMLTTVHQGRKEAAAKAKEGK